MTAPRTVKEVQSLTKKLAALTRFLSKATERQLPFFKTLIGCLKQKSFVWTSEAETAFQEMKKLLKTLPTLTTPVDGEILYLYVSVQNEAFDSVLVVKRDKIQKPVYFVSKALTGSEINYAPIEKFVYALILTSRRLRRYFQGHPVHVLTNIPVKQVLTKPEISGRLALWAVELGAYQISYLLRSAVKGQVLADYLAEMTGEFEVINERTTLKPVVDEIWDLFTDGDSCAEGAGAGLVLASPSGEEHTYALRFNFDVTNNEAEYEALLADSQLVANQFNGSFEAHDSSMQKYLQLLKELVERFEYFELAQVPRSQNKKEDALSKLAALTFGIPRELVSDNGTQIAKDPFKTWCTDLNIIQKFKLVAHPQANGLCEVTNRDIVSVIPAEILVPTHRVANFEEEANDDALGENLNFIEERRLMAAIREANNKQQIAKYYNKRVRVLSFDVVEWVLQNNDASRAEKFGKLGPNWEGPYQVVAINAAGSYKLADVEGRTLPNAWHAALLKRYYA
ncbi:uncharacterized protein [Rutidosis leptorrhynchoides]|uniref:uncharacterized protein n=1 Tax=Rutidosis leptorrhynchoides TaxID=125765 RepID=UPI003A9A0C80